MVKLSWLVIPWTIAWTILFVKYFNRKLQKIRKKEFEEILKQNPVYQMLTELEKERK